MARTDRKRRTRAHIIADLSVNHVEKHVLQCGWTVQRFNPDYGLDLMMTTFNRRGEIENGDVRLQIKATDSIKTAADGGAVSVRMEWRDMVYYLNEAMPVILVIYDAKSDRAWRVHLNKTLRGAGRAAITRSLTIRIPMENSLNKHAIRRFRRFRDAARHEIGVDS